MAGISEKKQNILEVKNILKQRFYHSQFRYKCFIKLNSPFSVFWEFIIAFAFSLTFWVIPLNIATVFAPYEYFRALELIIDVIIVLDIIINFISEQVKDIIVLEYISETSILYLKSFFIIDVLSILPNLIFMETNNTMYYFKLFRFFRINRFFSFFNMIERFILNAV